MPICPDCGATYFVAIEESSEAFAERAGTDCPVCILRRAPPAASLPDWVRRSARTALSFDATGDLRARIRRAVRSDGGDADDPAGDDTAYLRHSDLERLVRALDAADGSVEERTNRELRSRVVDAVGVDDSPASTFRKDALVDIALRVLERAPEE